MQKQSKEKTALGTQLKVGLKSIAKNYQLYLLLLPGLLWFLAFAYRPMSGLRIAFYDCTKSLARRLALSTSNHYFFKLK